MSFGAVQVGDRKCGFSLVSFPKKRPVFIRLSTNLGPIITPFKLFSVTANWSSSNDTSRPSVTCLSIPCYQYHYLVTEGLTVFISIFGVVPYARELDWACMNVNLRRELGASHA